MTPTSAGGKGGAASSGERLLRLRNALNWSQEGLAGECQPLYDVRQVRRAERNEPHVAPGARRTIVEALVRGIKKEMWSAAAKALPGVPADPETSEHAQRIVERMRAAANANSAALLKLEEAAKLLAEAEDILREPPGPPRRRSHVWRLVVVLVLVAIAYSVAWIWLNRAERRLLEGEDGKGEGQVMMRGAASEEHTVWLHAEEVRQFELLLSAPSTCRFRVRYSNDNSGVSETVTLSFDGRPVGSFRAVDTGNGGRGWNAFETSPTIATVVAAAGAHTIEVKPTGGDGYGIEIDAVAVRLKE